MKCNGRREYCELAFNQFTFPGTHNSGSGFDGPLKQCRTGNDEQPCIWQNQDLNITAQLQLGIRFLTFDTCILPDNCATHVYNGDISASRLMACQGGQEDVPFGGYRYGGLITQVLTQISDWIEMEENRNEVIGLQFTRNSPEINKSAIVRELIALLEERWCSTSEPDGTGCSNISGSSVTLNSQYNQTSTWPTLSQAIASNSRIFIFIDDALNIDELKRVWINPAPVSMSTFEQPSSTSHDCSRLYESVQYCNTSFELISATGFTLGICNNDVQKDCNTQLENVTNECHKVRQQYGQTVNVILVNYPEQATPPNTVFEVAEMLNTRNIKTYLPLVTTTVTESDVTTNPIANTTSSGRCALSNSIVIIMTVMLLKLMSIIM